MRCRTSCKHLANPLTRRGRIVGVSESVPGSVHDFGLLKRGGKIPKDTRVYVDSGYQWIQQHIDHTMGCKALLR
jgi:hypothetical protein